MNYSLRYYLNNDISVKSRVHPLFHYYGVLNHAVNVSVNSKTETSWMMCEKGFSDICQAAIVLQFNFQDVFSQERKQEVRRICLIKLA